MDIKQFTLKLTAYGSLLIAIIAFIGNILSFYIFSRKKFKKTIFSFYFRVEIVFNFLYLLMPINNYLEKEWNIHFKTISNLTCKLRYYYGDLTTPISNFILAIVSIDRYLTIVYPKSFFSFRKNLSFKISSCLFLTIFNLIYYIPDLVLFGLDVQNNKTINNETQILCYRKHEILNYLNFLNDAFIPFGIMTLFTILLLKSIYESRKRSRELINVSSSQTSNKTKSRDIRFAITSISVNLVFIFSTLPLYFSFFLLSYHNQIFIILDSFFMILYYTKFGSMFFINYFTNSLFRNEFNSIIRFKVLNSNQNGLMFRST